MKEAIWALKNSIFYIDIRGFKLFISSFAIWVICVLWKIYPCFLNCQVYCQRFFVFLFFLNILCLFDDCRFYSNVHFWCCCYLLFEFVLCLFSSLLLGFIQKGKRRHYNWQHRNTKDHELLMNNYMPIKCTI